MALNPNEQLLLEAVKNMLDDVALGVKAHKDLKQDDSSTFTFLHEEIEQAYRLETIDLEHQDAICSAFDKIHSYKYLDDPTFNITFIHEMAARAVPLEEQGMAVEAMEKVVKKHLVEMNEKDAGWNPNMKEIKKVSQPVAESKDTPKNQYDIEREFYSSPKIRKSIETNKAFWESVNRRITPQLGKLGYNCTAPKDFWEAYDDKSAEFAIRDDMHYLYAPLKAQLQPITEAIAPALKSVYLVQDTRGWPVAIVNMASSKDMFGEEGDWHGSMVVRQVAASRVRAGGGNCGIDDLVAEEMGSMEEAVKWWHELRHDTALMNDQGPEPFKEPEQVEPVVIDA